MNQPDKIDSGTKPVSSIMSIVHWPPLSPQTDDLVHLVHKAQTSIPPTSPVARLSWSSIFNATRSFVKPETGWTQAGSIQSLPEANLVAESGFSHYARFHEMEPHDTEDRNAYAAGGYHPVHIGDTYYSGKYVIVQKIGFDEFSTLWLARVMDSPTHVTLRFRTASSNAALIANESKLEKLMSKGTPSNLKNILQIFHSFTLLGPNGFHNCVVSQVVGPSVSFQSNCWQRISPTLVQTLSLQVTKALSFLHSNDMCQRNLNNETVTFALPSKLESNTFNKTARLRLKDQGKEHFGWNEKPRYLVVPATLSDEGQADTQPQIVLGGFEHAFSKSTPLHSLQKIRHTNAMYSAPEIIFEQQAEAASDVWALGCLIFNMRSGYDLFKDSDGSVRPHTWEDAAYGMISAIGNLPQQWAAGGFDGLGIPTGKPREGGNVLHMDSPGKTLRACVSSILDPPEKLPPSQMFWSPPGSSKSWEIVDEDEICSLISPDEADLLFDLLSKIFVYKPSDRITIPQILEHPWFTFTV